MSEANPYVTLVSSDNFRFIIPREAALGSEFIKDALESGFSEGTSSTVRFDDQRAEIIEKVAEYLMFKHRYSNSKEDIPDFKDRVRPEIALELLMASDFLGC